MKYRPACAKPCSDCPFRRKALAGWLGAATPQSFIIEISLDQPLPCHQTIDYADQFWQSKWQDQEIGKICAGALIMTANMCKLPRDRAFPRMKPDRELVFTRPEEFITYHEASPVRSWETDESREIRPATIDRSPICPNCESSTHTWCCARCGARTQTKTYKIHESRFCSAKCERDQLRDDKLSDASERS